MPSNIFQANPHDTILLCILSILSEQPQFIKRLLKSSSPSSPQFVEVWLFDSLKWKPQILDLEFPVEFVLPNNKFGEKGPPSIKYCRPLGKSLGGENGGTWQMFLEKAFARLYNGYDK